LSRRWRQHQRKGRCRKLFSAINKYGVDFFRTEVLTLTGTQETADTLEAQFIEMYNSINVGYNIRGAGAHGKLSEETKDKMRQSHLGKIISEGQREKARVANLGKKKRPPSIETRAKISKANTGRKYSDEARTNMSDAHLGKGHTKETRAKMSNTRKKMTIKPETRVKMNATRALHTPEQKHEIGQKLWATRRANKQTKGENQ